VLTAELERRSPERQRRLHRLVHDRIVAEIRATTGLDRQHTAQQLLFMHRRSPLTRTFWSLRDRGSAAVVPGVPEDHAAVVATVDRSLGPDNAALARGWLAEAPEGLHLVRGPAGLAAFALGLILPTGSAMERRDPVVRALLDHVDRTAPPRPGEQIHVSRFQGGVVDYEREDYGALAPSVAALITWLTRPLAWSFTVTSTPEVWGPFFEYLAFPRITDLSVGGRTFVLYGMDWRRLPVDVWMDLMNDRERTGTSGPAPASLLRPAPLTREAFSAAVRTALRDLHRDDRLAANPLMGTRLAQGPSGPSADVCRSQLRRAVACIGRQPRGAALHRVLDRTFVRPAPTQEAAAEFWACRSAPTAGTWPRRSTTWSTCSGPSRSARSSCSTRPVHR
jgi:hypothetical protein